MEDKLLENIISFLENDLGMKYRSIELGIKISNRDKTSLPISLWSHGLISTEELDKLYEHIWN